MRMTGSRSRTDTLILDACAVLSLYATQRIQDILDALSASVAVTDVVLGEALYVVHIVDGQAERERVDLGPLVQTGRMDVIAAESEEELLTFIDLAVDLDDGEAMSAALAIHRDCVLVTDDRKAERLLAGRVHMRSTLDVVKQWAELRQVPQPEVRAALIGIDQRGYRPARRHPLYGWWESVLFDN